MIKFIIQFIDKYKLKKEKNLKIKEIENIFKDKAYYDFLYDGRLDCSFTDLETIKKEILDNNYIINKVKITKQIETESGEFIDVDYLPISRGHLKERVILSRNEFLYFEGHSSFYRFKFNSEDLYINNGYEIISKSKEISNAIIIYKVLINEKDNSIQYEPIIIVN